MWASGYWATKGNGSLSLQRGLLISQRFWIQHRSSDGVRPQQLDATALGVGITRRCPHLTPGC